MLSIGTILHERYRVDRMLEIGALEGRYAGWDLEENAAVTIKELEPQPELDEETLQTLQDKFYEQAEALKQLRHPHIVRMLDYFCQGELDPFDEEGFGAFFQTDKSKPNSFDQHSRRRPKISDGVSTKSHGTTPPNAYLILQTVPGQTLADLIEREGTLREERVTAWARQILDALAYSHQRGIAHRDIRPENIVITPDDRAMVTNFEIIALWNPSDPRTWTAKRVMGTPEYAPPEQWGMKNTHVDTRSDIYSLGATLYHALTGEQPLTAGERTSNPYRFLQVKALAPRVNTALRTVVLRAMELPRDKRYQSATAMGRALDEDAPTSLVQLPPPAPLFPHEERAGWIRALGLLASVVILVGAGLLGLYLNQYVMPDLRVNRAVEAATDTAAATPTPVLGAVPEVQSQRATQVSTDAGQPGSATPAPTPTTAARAPSVEFEATVTRAPVNELDLAPTVTEVSPPDGWQVVVRDAFDTNENNWIENDHSDDFGRVIREVVDGTYRWEIDAEQAVGRWTTPELSGGEARFEDFYVRVQAQRLSGPETAAYGLVVRQTEDSYYLFNVRDDGYFQFMLWYGYAWQPVVDWTQTMTVRSGEVNELVVLAEGTTFEFYINGTRVGEAENEQLGAGEAGLSISTAATDETAIFVFDDFQLWAP